MIYTSAIWADEAQTMVIGTSADGATETAPAGSGLFRQPEHGPAGFVAAGGVIGPFVPLPTTLPDLAPYQFRAMLKLSGKQDVLYAFIAALPEPARTVAQSKLEYSLVFKRDNDLVAAAKQALGLSDAELDGLWTQAFSIV